MVSLHDLNTLELQEQLTKTKGATGFAITSNVEKDSDGVPTIVSRIAISVKRKIFIYSWNDAELLDVEVKSMVDMRLILGILVSRSSQEFDLDDIDETVSGIFLRLRYSRHLERHIFGGYFTCNEFQCTRYIRRYGCRNRIP